VVMMSSRSTSSRERALATAFADLSGVLAADRDVSAALQRLCQYCVQLLGVAAAGVLLVKEDRVTVAASSAQPARLLLEHSGDADPCGACLRTGAPLLVPDVAAREQVWPVFVAEARKQGFASAYALPMRLRAVTQGVLGLFGTQPDSLTAESIQIAQALADALMAGITQQWALDRAEVRAGQLQQALDSRVVIEQAKGVLSQRGNTGVDQAFVQLRQYARSHNQSLHQLATQVMADGGLADDVLHDSTPPPDSAAEICHGSVRTPRRTS
jgi:hypothetical protein